MWLFDLAFMLDCVQTDLNGAWAGAKHQAAERSFHLHLTQCCLCNAPSHLYY